MKNTAKAKILKQIEKSESFIVIFMEDEGNEIAHMRHEISNADVITACEVIKFNTLKLVTKGK
jgi:hypothetical protein